MQKFESVYSQALENILYNGIISSDRTGTGTKRIPTGVNMSFDLKDGFPAIAGKKVTPRNSLIEVIWMLKGLNNISFLKENGVNYWDKWADEQGYLGPSYGGQIRHFNKGLNDEIIELCEKNNQINSTILYYQELYHIDQVKKLISDIKTNPDSRRLILTFWNPAEIHLQKLPPCYLSMQFIVINNVLHLHATQRSGDMFLGVPYDMMNFSLFLQILAYLTNLNVGTVNIKINDAHIYLNHLEQCKQYLGNLNQEKSKMVSPILDSPTIFKIRPSIFSKEIEDINMFIENSEKERFDNMAFENYKSFPFIKAEVSV